MVKFLQKLKFLFSSLFGRKKVIRLGIYGEPNTGKTTLANKISMDWLGEPVGEVSEMPHTTRTIQKKEHIEVKHGSKKLVMNLLDMPGLATQVDFRKFMKFYKPVSNPDGIANLKTSELKKIAVDAKVDAEGSKKEIVKKLKAKLSENEIRKIILKLNIKQPKGKGKKYSKEEAKKIAEEATKGIVEAIKWLDNVDTVLVMMDSTKDPLTQVNIMLVGNLEAKGIPMVIVANKTDLKNASVDRIRNAFPQYSVIGVSALKGSNLEELYDAIAMQSVNLS